MFDETVCIVDCLTCKLVTVCGVIGADRLMTLYKRSGKQLANHIVEGVGLHIHCLGYLLFLVVRNHVTVVT